MPNRLVIPFKLYLANITSYISKEFKNYIKNIQTHILYHSSWPYSREPSARFHEYKTHASTHV